MYKNKHFLVFLLTAGLLMLYASKPVSASENDIWQYLGEYTDVEDDDRSSISNSIVVGDFVYEYQPEKDCFNAVYIANRKKPHLKVDAYVLGKPVTGISLFVETGTWVKRLTLPETIREPLYFDEDNGTGIVSLTLPYGMTNPGYITGQPSLQRVTLPQTVTVSGCFRNNPSLKYIYFSHGIKIIQKHAFSWCPSLSEMSLPDSVTKIEPYAFYNCRKLNLYVPPSVKKIGKGAFGEKNSGKIKMLYCVKNSAAHKFAKKNHIPFSLVSKKAPKAKVTSIKIPDKTLCINLDETRYLEKTLKPFYASKAKLIYSSSNPKVLKITKSGEMQALTYGKSVVRVKSASKNKLSAKVTVYVKPPAVNNLEVENYGNTDFLSWDSVDEAQGYEVWYRTTKEKKFKRITVSKINKISVKTKKTNFHYCYRVRAYRKYGKKKIFGDFSICLWI